MNPKQLLIPISIPISSIQQPVQFAFASTGRAIPWRWLVCWVRRKVVEAEHPADKGVVDLVVVVQVCSSRAACFHLAGHVGHRH